MTPVEWLTDEQQRTWLELLTVTLAMQAALDRQLQRDAGMPHAYFGLLTMLAGAPGRSRRITDLAELTDSSQSRVSHAVARLEDAGWIRRERDPHDRRSTFAVLTDDGYAAQAAAAPGHVREVRAILIDRLSGEQLRQLGDICRTLLATMNPVALERIEAGPGRSRPGRAYSALEPGSRHGPLA